MTNSCLDRFKNKLYENEETRSCNRSNLKFFNPDSEEWSKSEGLFRRVEVNSIPKDRLFLEDKRLARFDRDFLPEH